MNATPYRVIVTGSRFLSAFSVVDARLDAVYAGLDDGQPLLVRHGACPSGADEATHLWCLDRIVAGDPVVEDPHPADWDHCTPNCPPPRGHRRTKRPGDTAHPGVMPDYCPAAGPRRNAVMVRLGADQALAFPDATGPSYGTRGCIRLIRKARIPLDEVTV